MYLSRPPRLWAVAGVIAAAAVAVLLWQGGPVSPAQVYTSRYFDDLVRSSERSAAVIAPDIVELLQPRSVIDVGCGTCSWAAAFRSLGVEDVVGIDGDYVDRATLSIPPSMFLARNLEDPLTLDRSFDLALSLEVAEHLTPERAETFVADLTSLSSAVLFSAAIPDQGGAMHLNERWPDYWQGLFERRGFRAVDYLRMKYWEDDRVAWWYRQNMVLYVSAGLAGRDQRLAQFLDADRVRVPRLVHPDLFASKVGPNGVRHEIRDLATAIRRTAARRIGLAE